jgi:hypothetical protein
LNKNHIHIQNPEKLGESSIVKGTKLWNIIYEGRNLKIGVDNYLWSVYSYPVGKWEGYLQINKPIHSVYDGERDINGIPTRIPQTQALQPIPYIGMMGDETIDIWVQRDTEWKYIQRPVWMVKDIHNIKTIITSFFD